MKSALRARGLPLRLSGRIWKHFVEFGSPASQPEKDIALAALAGCLPAPASPCGVALRDCLFDAEDSAYSMVQSLHRISHTDNIGDISYSIAAATRRCVLYARCFAAKDLDDTSIPALVWRGVDEIYTGERRK